MKAHIQSALIELVQRYPLDTIQVTQIAEQAMMDRSTFYRHYKDIHGVVEDIFSDQIAALLDDVGDLPSPREAQGDGRVLDELKAIDVWASLFTRVRLNGRVFAALLGGGSSWFQHRMKTVLGDSFALRVRSTEPEGWATERFDLVRTHMADTLVSIVQRWLEEDMRQSPTEIARWTHHVLSNGFLSPLPAMPEEATAADDSTGEHTSTYIPLENR